MAFTAAMWHINALDAMIVMGKQGRVVIPAGIREQLGIAADDLLHLHTPRVRVS